MATLTIVSTTSKYMYIQTHIISELYCTISACLYMSIYTYIQNTVVKGYDVTAPIFNIASPLGIVLLLHVFVSVCIFSPYQIANS